MEPGEGRLGQGITVAAAGAGGGGAGGVRGTSWKGLGQRARVNGIRQHF